MTLSQCSVTYVTLSQCGGTQSVPWHLRVKLFDFRLHSLQVLVVLTHGVVRYLLRKGEGDHLIAQSGLVLVTATNKKLQHSLQMTIMS